MKKTVVTLPEGMTANPSLAEGLEACSPAELDRRRHLRTRRGLPAGLQDRHDRSESPTWTAGASRAPSTSPPLIPTTSAGAENPFDSLIALYIVVKDRDLGVLVKQAGKVEPDPATGQLRTTSKTSPSAAHPRPDAPAGGRPEPADQPTELRRLTTVAELTPSGEPTDPLRHLHLPDHPGPRRLPLPPGRARPSAPLSGRLPQQPRRRLLALPDAAHPPRRRPGPDPFDAVLPPGISPSSPA